VSWQNHLKHFKSSVSLEGTLRASHGLTHKFTGFFITVETDSNDAKTPRQKYGDDSVVGNFHIVANSISKLSDKCSNLVTQNNSLPKSDVPVCEVNLIDLKFHFAISIGFE
jgi:hypothetical protein